MRLSEFLRTHSAQILSAWDEFAATVEHTGHSLDQKALRDHAGQILSAVAADLDRPQSDAQQEAKSRGESARRSSADTAAETHADTRIAAGFAIDALITEYRALRASVLRLWSQAQGDAPAEPDTAEQLTRFNEAIDQAISESVARYTEQVNQSASLFMGVLGHDIRNPLGTISLSAELLSRSGEFNAKAVRQILESARRIQGLIDLVVDYSRAQSAAAMPIDTRPGDLAALFRKLVEETRSRHPSHTVLLESKGDFAGEWDERRMGQLLSNLLENAIQYGARTEPVSVRMNGDATQVRLEVHNFGRPIDEANRRRIFEPRTRGTAVDEQRAPNGLGLGLYICREIVKAHHGTLTVESGADAGTSFVVSMPREAAGVSPRT